MPEKRGLVLLPDLLPQLTEQALAEMLFARRKTGLNAGELFTGILHNRLGRVLVQETGIGLNTPIAQLPEKALHRRRQMPSASGCI